MEDKNKILSEKERYEVRQIAVMQAIAENNAKKSSTAEKHLFALGLGVLFLNALAAVLALFIGCWCDTEKPVLYWVLLGIYVAAIAVSFALSLSERILSRKSRKQDENIDDKAKSGNMPLNEVLQMYENDTEQVKAQKAKARRLYFVSMCITAVTTISAIMTYLFACMI